MNRTYLIALGLLAAPVEKGLGEEWKPSRGPALIPPEMFEIADPELEVTVWASSPQLFNPTNIDIDSAGRIWVAEGVNYRGNSRANGGKGQRPAGDRIVVLQDTDGDGRCDSSHTFVQDPGLIAPLGVAVIDNVIYVAQPPDMLAYTDVDRNLKFDPEIDRREVLLTGFNAINHDHGLHALTAGPDGKFYFNNGNCGAVFTDKSGTTFYLGGTYGGSGPQWPVDHISKTGKRSDDGHVWTSGFAVRMDPDGSNAEIISHGLRNSYEQTVTSFGDVFQNDNDDPRGCRTSFALEYGCAGYFTRDGKQRNKAVRRPGQAYARVHWRQDDPGTMDAGDVYGGGAPTGIAFYENGALGEKWSGLLLSCDAALNTILGYQPAPKAGTFELERIQFLTSNPGRKYDGVDFVGGARNNTTVDKIAPSLFRPSDVAVGPDGAVYFSDWFDPRIGASSHLDASFSGAIYRIAPRGFKPVVPAFDLSTTEGQITALRSPAVNTRFLGFRALKDQGADALPALKELLVDANKWVAARAVWLLPHLGDEGVAACAGLLDHDESQWRVVAYRALRRAGNDILPYAERLASDPSPQVRREVALSLRDLPAERTADIFVELAKRCDTGDKNSVEAIGLGAANQESAIWKAIKHAVEPGEPIVWPEPFVRLTWRLWGAASVDDLKERALSLSLTSEQRRFAVESIGFIDDRAAAEALLELAADGSPVKNDATVWLLRNLVGEWANYDLAESLKRRGIYNPESMAIVESPLPEVPAGVAGHSVAEILAIEGDPERGKVASARCLLCHQVDGNGADYGPDLKGWAAAQSREAVVRAIAEPSAGIALGYNGTEVLLKGGGVIHGIAFNNNDHNWDKAPPLVIQSAGGVTQLVPKERIEKKRELGRSLMYEPASLGLNAQDIADLAAWLETYR